MEQNHSIDVRRAVANDMAAVGRMMHSLTGESYDFGDEVVYVADRPGAGLAGFISLSIRPWAEGCESAPVPYIEGWWVEPDARHAGVGTALVKAAEDWCRDAGFTELGSDVEVDNAVSLDAHRSLGFSPTVRLQFFRRTL